MAKTFNNFTAKKTSHYSKPDLDTKAAAFYYTHVCCDRKSYIVGISRPVKWS